MSEEKLDRSIISSAIKCPNCNSLRVGWLNNKDIQVLCLDCNHSCDAETKSKMEPLIKEVDGLGILKLGNIGRPCNCTRSVKIFDIEKCNDKIKYIYDIPKVFTSGYWTVWTQCHRDEYSTIGIFYSKFEKALSDANLHINELTLKRR